MAISGNTGIANLNAPMAIYLVYLGSDGVFRDSRGVVLSGNLSVANFNSPVAISALYYNAAGTWSVNAGPINS